MKEKGMFIIKIGGDTEEEIKEKIEEKTDTEFSKNEFGGYTPKSLVKALESVKESIADKNTREALMKIDSCIVRLTKRPLPSTKDDPFTNIDYQLDNVLPNQGK